MRPRRACQTVPGSGPQRETAKSFKVLAPAFLKERESPNSCLGLHNRRARIRKNGPHRKEGARAVSATTTKVYVGVDVSKGRLEVFVAPTGERFGVTNDDTGVDELLARLEESSLPR